MTEDDALARYGLPPSMADLPEIRSLLTEEAERCRKRIGNEPLLRLYCLMLFSVRDMVDVIPIWRAKQSNFDTVCGIDIQFMCAGGFAETKAYLANCPASDAKEALQCLAMCEEDFRDWTPQHHLLNWKWYYRLA